MEVLCPRCHRSTEAPEEWAGRQIKCGSCRHMLKVPTPGQLRRERAVKEGVSPAPSFQFPRAAVWLLRIGCAVCWLSVLGLLAARNFGASTESGKNTNDEWEWFGLAAFAGGAFLLYLGERLHLRIIEMRRDDWS